MLVKENKKGNLFCGVVSILSMAPAAGTLWLTFVTLQCKVRSEFQNTAVQVKAIITVSTSKLYFSLPNDIIFFYFSDTFFSF